jgi:hypothetical protein
MTATPEIIPTDLTLEIGEDLSPDRFMAAARAFFGYVQEITQALAPEGEAPRWTVRVREGSSLLAVEPAPSAPAPLIQSVYSRAENGVLSVSSGDTEESGLTEAALKHLRVLSELSEGPKGRPTSMRLWVRRKPVDVGAKIAEVIREDWRVDYYDYGTIEGRLETIRDKDGALQMQVRDAMLRQTVRCSFPEEMLQEAFANFRKRVEVSGTIHYRKNGAPVSIDAARIEKLPEDSELPTPQEVRGILRLNS